MARGQRKGRSEPLTDLSLARSGHCCAVTKVYHLHVYLSLVNVKILVI